MKAHAAGGTATLVAISISILGTATTARAGEPDGERDAPDQERIQVPQTQRAAAKGAFLPLQGAAVVEQRAYAAGMGGFDTARDSASFGALTEMRLWGPIAVRAGAVYTQNGHALRPSVGARVQALSEGRHGLDAALGVFYRPEGLTEPEGEIETVLSFGRHVGRTYVLGNLAYGQDPEGNERDGEVRAAALLPFGARFLAGLDGRLRYDLGSDAAKLALHHEATRDLMLGPSAQVFIGPIALLVEARGSAVRFSGSDTKFGAFFMAGAGAAF